MPVSFEDKEPVPPVPPVTTPSDVDKSGPRTTQFFADRTRSVLVGDQGGIGRWGRSGDLSLPNQDGKEQPPVNGNALAMKFRAAHQKVATSSSSGGSQVR